MQSKAGSVAQYLSELVEPRRAMVQALRDVVLANLDSDYAESMQYGMIGYNVPHSVFPAGYHCDPKQPLPFAAIASQKNYVSLYMMGLYCGAGADGESEDVDWFRHAWEATGRKLDMGKACVRFKKIDDIAFEVVGVAIARIPARLYIERYLSGLKR